MLHRMWMRALFSFRGRLRRSSFWRAAIVVGAGFVLSFVAIERGLGHGPTLLLYPPFFWAALGLMTRRLHDRDKSGAWLLVLLVPVLGPLWTAFDLGLRRGTRGGNRYGADPRDARAPYARVA